MDVRMPDGTIVTNVPDNITQEELLSAYSGYTPPPVSENPIYGVAANITPSLATGIGSLLQAPGKLADLITGTAPGEKAGVGRTLLGALIPGGAKTVQEAGAGLEEVGQAAKTIGLQQKEKERAQKIADTEGELNKFGVAFSETLTDPTLISSFLFEQLPNSLGAGIGGILTKNAGKLLFKNASEKALGAMGVSGTVATGAAMQGADVGYDTYKDIYQRLVKEGMDPAEANLVAAQKGRVAALEAGGLSYAVSKIPGAREFEKALFKETRQAIPKAGLIGTTKGAAKGALGEGAGELIEETGGQFASNVGKQEVFPETDLTAGLGETGAMALLGGAGMGGVGGGINARSQARAQKRLEEELAIKKAADARDAAVAEALKDIAPEQAVPEQAAEQPTQEVFYSEEPLPQEVLDQGYQLVGQQEEDGKVYYAYTKEEPIPVKETIVAPVTEKGAQEFAQTPETQPAQTAPAQLELAEQPASETPPAEVAQPAQLAQPENVQPVDPNVEARLAVEPVEPVAPSEPPPVAQKSAPKAAAPKAGEKILSAHEYIASLGGLDKKEAAEINPDAAKSNVRIGNKWLYASKGGLNASQAAEKLLEAGYITAEDNNEVYRVINDSLVDPVYSSYDADTIAERRFQEQVAEDAAKFAKQEAEAGVEAEQISAEEQATQGLEQSEEALTKFMLDAGYTQQDLNVVGFTKASPELKAEVAELERQMKALGIDASSIIADASFESKTDLEYYNRAKSELAKAIAQAAKQGSRGDVSQANVPPPPAAKEKSLRQYFDDLGYKLLPRDSARNFQDFATREKDGVRFALDQGLLFEHKNRVMMAPSEQKALTIHALIVDKDKRGQGKAKETMQMLVDRADQTGMTLYVEPIPIDDKLVKKEDLQKFYASFGFQPAGEKIMSRVPQALTSPTKEELTAKQAAADKAAEDKARADREAEAKAKADAERKEISARSEKAAGEFELGKTAEEDLTGQKDIFSTPVQISPEQQKIDALNKLETALKKVVAPFRAVSATGTSVLRPRPLNDKQIALIRDLASEAIDLGMPAFLFENISAAGATRMSSVAAMAPKYGWLLLGKDWSSTSRIEKLQSIIHEFGHSVDTEKATISNDAAWQKSHDELKKWYDSSAVKKEHPLAYPFDKQFNGKVRIKAESFAQSLALYFVSPVELQINAPETYSQIQSIVEGIQNESQRASAASATKAGVTAVKVQQPRSQKSAEVQSEAGAIGSGVSQAERFKDRNDQRIDKIQIPAANTVPTVPSTGTPRMNVLGAPIAGTWAAAPETTLTPWIYKIQDKQIDLKDAQKQIEKTVGKIDDALNAYRKETLYYGRVADQTERFLTEELKPLLQEMIDKKLSLDEVDKYLQALHAPERNASIAKRINGMPDGGAGISTADAQAYLASLSPDKARDLKDISDRVRKIIAGTQAVEVNGGLELKSKIDGWNKAWPNYVPLFRDEVDYVNQGSGMGQGFSTRGSSSKRAVGSDKPVKEIIASLAEQRQKAIVRSEKARVGKALYALAIANPNPDYWLAIDPNSKEDIKKVEQMLQDYGFDPGDIAQLVQNMAQEPRTGSVKRVFNPVTKQFDEVVKYDINTQNRYSSNVLPVRINGEDKFLFFNPSNDRAKRMAESIKNLDAEQLGEGVQTLGNITRFIAALSTQYNPIFGAFNFARDVQGAALNLSTTPLKDKKTEVVAGAFKAMKGIYAEVRARREGKQASGYYSDLYREFESEGGKTGFINQFNNLNKKGTIVERELKGLTQGKVKGVASAMANWLSDYNDTLENAVRLSAYEQGVKMGLSKEESAELAKNLTVNFNRKGAKTAWAGALYAFFNSAVQGTARLYETLRGPAGKKIIAGGILLGAFQAALLAMAGFDEDEPSEFVKQKNIIIPMLGGGYIMIPMPLGFNVLPNIGRIISEIAFGTKKSGVRKFGDLMDAVVSAFNPLGSGSMGQMLMPTVGDPIANVLNNKDSFGRPISKEDRAMNPSPGYLRSRESVGALSKGIAEFLNYVSGGTQFNKGFISPTGDDINYVVGQYLGGVGREVMRAKEFATSIGKEEPFEPYKVPIVGKVYGDINAPASVASKFYLNVKQMAEHENEIKGRKGSAISEYMRDNPDARLYRNANRLENEISKLNKNKKALVERDAPEAAIRRIEDQKLRMMRQFNEQVRKLQ